MKKWSHKLNQWVEEDEQGNITARYCSSCLQRYKGARDYCSDRCEQETKEFIEMIKGSFHKMFEEVEAMNEMKRIERECERC